MNTTPAQIIANQLGGTNRLKAMLGAKEFYSDNNGQTLVFKIGRGAIKSINYIKITLNSMDLYDIEYGRKYNKKCKLSGAMLPAYKTISESKGIYNSMLMDDFEENTGMYLTLHARR